MISSKLQKEFPILTTIPSEKFPKHIFIIPDGNGRWAKAQGKFVAAGHKKGFDAAYEILQMLSGIDEVSVVTIWGFSADNWKRSEKEVAGLMLLFERVIQKTLKDLLKNNGRFIHLGRKDRIPKRLLNIIDDAEAQTKGNTGQIVCLAIDFGGEDQEARLLQQVRPLDQKTEITNDTLWQLRDGHGLVKSADLLIRTSGEKRLSDVGWINGAQTELYFLGKYFPDVTPGDIVEAIVDFSQRERRYGGRKA